MIGAPLTYTMLSAAPTCVAQDNQLPCIYSKVAVDTAIHAYLVVNGVHLCQNKTLNHLRSRRPGQISKPLVELGELIHSIIAHQCLTHKQGQIWLVQVDEVAQGAHEWLVILHAACEATSC